MMQCAMNMGAVVGIYYIGKFCLFPLSLHSTLAAMLFLGLTLMVPFLVYRLVPEQPLPNRTFLPLPPLYLTVLRSVIPLSCFLQLMSWAPMRS